MIAGGAVQFYASHVSEHNRVECDIHTTGGQRNDLIQANGDLSNGAGRSKGWREAYSGGLRSNSAGHNEDNGERTKAVFNCLSFCQKRIAKLEEGFLCGHHSAIRRRRRGFRIAAVPSASGLVTCLGEEDWRPIVFFAK